VKLPELLVLSGQRLHEADAAIDRWTAVVNWLSRSLHSSDRSLSRRPKTTLTNASAGRIENASRVRLTLRAESTHVITTSVAAATTVLTSTLRIVWQPNASEFRR
jgi:hypothetical protein